MAPRRDVQPGSGAVATAPVAVVSVVTALARVPRPAGISVHVDMHVDVVAGGAVAAAVSVSAPTVVCAVAFTVTVAFAIMATAEALTVVVSAEALAAMTSAEAAPVSTRHPLAFDPAELAGDRLERGHGRGEVLGADGPGDLRAERCDALVQ